MLHVQLISNEGLCNLLNKGDFPVTGEMMNDLPSEVSAEPGEKRQDSILTIWKCKAISWTLNFSFLDISMMALLLEK